MADSASEVLAGGVQGLGFRGLGFRVLGFKVSDKTGLWGLG